jgi:hypothetical protein
MEKNNKVMTDKTEETLKKELALVRIQKKEIVLQQDELNINRAKELLEIPDFIEIVAHYGCRIAFYAKKKLILTIQEAIHKKSDYCLIINPQVFLTKTDFQLLAFCGNIAKSFENDSTLYSKLFTPDIRIKELFDSQEERENLIIKELYR